MLKQDDEDTVYQKLLKALEALQTISTYSPGMTLAKARRIAAEVLSKTRISSEE